MVQFLCNIVVVSLGHTTLAPGRSHTCTHPIFIPEWKIDRQTDRQTGRQTRRIDGLEVKNIYCSSKGPVFDYQQPHGSSQTLVTPIPGHPATSWGLHKYQAYTRCPDIQAVKIPAHIKF